MKVSDDGDTVPSVVSVLATSSTTFPAGLLASFTVKVAVAPASVVASRFVIVVEGAGDTTTAAVSSSVMASAAPVTAPTPWELRAVAATVTVTVTALSGASTSLSTAVITAVSAAFTVCPAAMTMVAPAPEATV